MSDAEERKVYFNDKLRSCKTTSDFISLQTEMNDVGYGNWFRTKRGNGINCIWTHKDTTSRGTPYYCSSQYGKPIIKDGKPAVAYDTVRNSQTKLCTIDSLHRYWVIV